MIWLWPFYYAKKAEESAIGFGGLQKGQGEFTLYRIYKVGNTVYSIFHSWRGSQYDAQAMDDKSLPATMEEVKNYIVATQDTYICDQKNPEGKCQEFLNFISKFDNMNNSQK